jgi:hypothetical protein
VRLYHVCIYNLGHILFLVFLDFFFFVLCQNLPCDFIKELDIGITETLKI